MSKLSGAATVKAKIISAGNTGAAKAGNGPGIHIV
jgi:hypothetical protein